MQASVGWKWRAVASRPRTGRSTCKSSRQEAISVRLHLPTTKFDGMCLSLLVDQGPTARILALFTFRPDFSPPWTGRAHLTQVTVNRLSRHQAAEVIRQVALGKALLPGVVEQIVAKTDGVPLFVEELTKMV